MKAKIISEGDSFKEIVQEIDFFIKILVKDMVQLQCLISSSQNVSAPKKPEFKSGTRKAETYSNYNKFNKSSVNHAFNADSASKPKPDYNNLSKVSSKPNKNVTFGSTSVGAKSPKTKGCPMLDTDCGGMLLAYCI